MFSFTTIFIISGLFIVWLLGALLLTSISRQEKRNIEREKYLLKKQIEINEIIEEMK